MSIALLKPKNQINTAWHCFAFMVASKWQAYYVPLCVTASHLVAAGDAKGGQDGGALLLRGDALVVAVVQLHLASHAGHLPTIAGHVVIEFVEMPSSSPPFSCTLPVTPAIYNTVAGHFVIEFVEPDAAALSCQ